ncbi:hypothetical protein EDEG_00720 [Edhazardia aedis USNM 41457]|uniref:Endonuclease/exonuclease/phosphatase domain-containing protein n=1 Tax=Edhazardia aedis (strain USNM 41457) TaxID=1003232 RepID=J8ZZX0_EDHAE|nr:hypothetical protein EDEG_00720 [Edhazardia aedis USNM 41457]|eukprot:EJW05188.1 hypothetical protein EDEG_00720 [Edhazardia aedis USNM 41457]
MQEAISALESKYRCKLRRQKLERNRTLEKQEVGKGNLTSILSLNCSGLNGKLQEINVFLDRVKPDVVCLQETHRVARERTTYLPGYVNFEAPMEEGGLDLLMAIRKA